MASTSKAPLTTSIPPFQEFDNIEGCYAWHCYEKANATCAEQEHCCVCRCNKLGFPIADRKNKKCVPFTVQTTANIKTLTEESLKANEGCKDLKTDCFWLQGLGECDTNPSYMRKSCPKSCNLCAKTTAKPSAKPTADCKDTNARCGSWAKRGDCQSEPKYMMQFCVKSCTNCTGKPLVSSTPVSTVLPSAGPTTKNSSTAGIPPKAPLKHSAPVAAIAGSIAGILVLIICIAILCFFLNRRRKRSKSNESTASGQGKAGNNTQQGSAPLLSANQQQHEEFEMKEAENPYYKSADDTENHYHSPGDVLQGVHAPNQQEVYYSIADVVKPTAEKECNQKWGNKTEAIRPGLNQEYAYACSDSATLPPRPNLVNQTNHQNQYAPLGQSSDEPGLYETLQEASNPAKSTSKADNPYDAPTLIVKASLDPKSDLSKGLSMKNNAGSRENVSQKRMEVKQGGNQYQELTTPRQNPIYQPTMQQDEEYLDMSVGDGSGGELTTPRQNPIYQPTMQQDEEYLDMSVGDGSGGEYLYVDPADH